MFASLGPASAHARRSIAALAGALTLAACQTFSPDGGLSVASDVARNELRKDIVSIQTEDDASAAQARVLHLIGPTLTADAAVQVALLTIAACKRPVSANSASPRPCTSGSRLPPNPQLWIVGCLGSIETELEGI